MTRCAKDRWLRHGRLSGSVGSLPPGGRPLRRYQTLLRRLRPGTQRALLEAEGVPFTPDGRVDLTACLWDGKLY